MRGGKGVWRCREVHLNIKSSYWTAMGSHATPPAINAAQRTPRAGASLLSLEHTVIGISRHVQGRACRAPP